MKKTMLVVVFVLGLFALSACSFTYRLRIVQVTPTPTTESGIIPGTGSQLDYSQGMSYAKIIVFDDKVANSAGYFDRQVYNSADPSYISLPTNFVLPTGWTVERDFSEKNNQFVGYYTVKAPIAATAADVASFAKENNYATSAFEITSVIVKNGQECSMSGLVDNRVRVNIYVGQNLNYQPCN